MDFDYILLFLSLMFPLVFSPGPANIVFAMSGIKQGFKKSIPLLLGINLVFIVYSIIIGFGLAAFFQKFPFLIKIIQIIGAIYIFYLGYKFFKDKNNINDKVSSTNKVFTFKDGVVLQLLNAKGITMLLLMFSVLLNGSFKRTKQIVALIVMLAILNITTHIIWILGGSFISKFLKNEKTHILINSIFSLSLFGVGFYLIYDVFH